MRKPCCKKIGARGTCMRARAPSPARLQMQIQPPRYPMSGTLTGPPTLTAAQRTAHCSCRAGQVNVTTRWLAWLGVELDELVGDRRRREHAQVREQQRDVPCRAAREYTLQGLACPAP